MLVMRKKGDEAPPDWSESPTAGGELWKNPLFTNADNLLIADGAIAWRDQVIANLREQLAAAKKDGELLDYLDSLPNFEILKDGSDECTTVDGLRKFKPIIIKAEGKMAFFYETVRSAILSRKSSAQ